MGYLKFKAVAKINWRLAVTGRRADGYHLLSGLMQSISLADTVYLRESERDSCRIRSGPAIEQEHNLAFAAWLLLKRELGLKQGLEIEIEKLIPLGGGLGGGSADAAAVLAGANELLHLGLGHAELSALALQLGVDVPFCLLGGLALAEGVGERLTPLPSPPALHVLLVNPGFAVPTAQVFAHYQAACQPFADARAEEQACAELAKALARGDVPAINRLLANDLAKSARQLYPAIGLLERRMRALGLTPLLSGSGGTVLALVESETALTRAKQSLADLPWVEDAHTIA